MTKFYTNIYHSLKASLTVLAMLLAAAVPARALPLTTYTANSRLASGKWVRISVEQSGIHSIPESTLRSWGFQDPSKVKVHGYGARRLPDALTASTYIDDLPQTPSEYVQGKGVFFYADGPVGWKEAALGYFRPAHNPFTLKGYYFLSDSGEEERLVPQQSGKPAEHQAGVTKFYDRVFHEKELSSPGEAGFLLVGEDFKFTQSQTFPITLTDAVEDGEVKVEVSFYCKSSESSSIEVSAPNQGDNTTVSASIEKIKDDKYSHGKEALARKTFNLKDSKLSVKIDHKTKATVSSANLNYIAVTYQRHLRLPASKSLLFYLTSNATDRFVTLGNATSGTRVWDVTQPLAVTAVNAELSDGYASWESSYTSSPRTYAAWDPAGSFPTPVFVENVANQDLHAKDVPEMVIFTPGEWRSQAERLADYHRANSIEPLDVLVLTPQQVYNEYSSGSPDAQAFRKMLKMFYDRGNSGEGKQLKYALFFGRPTYDPRRLSSKVQGLRYPMLPAWSTDDGIHDNTSYTTDDMFAFLEDNSGVNISRDKLSIAVGRITSTSASEAKAAVDKILYYTSRMPRGIWQNTMLVTADDGDSAIHMIQADSMSQYLLGSAPEGADVFLRKVYIDQFEIIGGKYPEARTLFYRNLDEGALWWLYIGHANASSLTGEGLVTFTDLNNNMYLRHWPVLYAATCDFLRWDSSVVSGAEILFNTSSGGVISAISATRPVYISENTYMSDAMGQYMLSYDENGTPLTIGEIYRRAKNSINSNSNKLRYVLLGDPAIRTVLPQYHVNLDKIGEKTIVPLDGKEEPAQLMARQQTTLTGRITDSKGNELTDFNGTINATLYDAEYSVTTLGNEAPPDKIGKPHTFQQQGDRIFVGSGIVENGRFTINVSMPTEVADNYSPAAFNFYASATDGREAAGVCRQLYVYGTDETALPDTEAPVIGSIYLNHPNFRNGQEVNPAPMLIASVTDDRAMNLSGAGIGHQMSLYLDNGSKVYTDVANYFTPFSDGTPGGTIAYPIENLASGPHNLRLRVWDTGPNSTEASVDFVVAEGIAPVLYDVYTDANPASTEANFYITHDRPDRNVRVTVEVFNLMGRLMWSATESGRSDMFTSMPITWDLMDQGGRRVPRGIYIYRATISDSNSGEETSTAARKLAVTGM